MRLSDGGMSKEGGGTVVSGETREAFADGGAFSRESGDGLFAVVDVQH